MTTPKGFPTSAWSTEALTDLINEVTGGVGTTITGATIENSTVGVSTPAAGKFTTLQATSTVTLSPSNHNIAISPTGSGTVTISPAGVLTFNPTTASAMDNVVIGANTAKAATVTTFTATGVVSLSNASVSMTAIPTVDPHVIGRLWSNSGVLTISAGP